MHDAWQTLRHANDADIPLFATALLIARDEYPGLDAAAYESHLHDYTVRLRQSRRKNRESTAQLQAINRLLFDDLGFSGDDHDYYDPRNSYLNDVLDRRVGNPISLAVVQIELARRLGVPLQGISFPGHFLVLLPLDEGMIVLDPFQKGRSLDVAELRRRARAYTEAHEIDDDNLARMLEPASHRAILVRMLRNLKGVYAEREQWEKAARCCDRLLTLDAHSVAEYRDRGTCYLRLGHAQGARSDWQRYLALMPQADDAEEIGLKLAELGGATPRLN